MTEHVSRVGRKECIKYFIRKLERNRNRLSDYIKIDLKETGREECGLVPFDSV
jgi:hypothetical protein